MKKKIFVFIISGLFISLICFNISLNLKKDNSSSLLNFFMKDAFANDGESGVNCFKVELSSKVYQIYRDNGCCQTEVGDATVTEYVYIGQGCPSGTFTDVIRRTAFFGVNCCA